MYKIILSVSKKVFFCKKNVHAATETARAGTSALKQKA